MLLNCFRIYERIILSNDLDLFSQLLWLFNNITINDNETCFNIILSSLFKYKIIELLQQEIFIINVNENGIFQTIIEEGIKFLRNLLLMNYKIYDCVQDLEILKLKYQIIKILINFMGTNDENNYAKILDSIIIFSDMKNNSYSKEILSTGFIENLIDEKKMFSNKEIILLFNRIIGNFIAVNDDKTTLMCETLNGQEFKINELNVYDRYSAMDKKNVVYRAYLSMKRMTKFCSHS